MVNKKIIALLGAGYAATQTNILGGAAGSQQQQRPGENAVAPATMAPGLGIAPGLGRSQQPGQNAPGNAGMNVTFQAPEVGSSGQSEPMVRYVPQNPTNTSGGGTSSDGNKQGSKGKSPNADNSGSSGSSGSIDLSSIDSSSGSSDNSVPINMGQDDSGDGSVQTDSGINAADTPGVQSTEPDQVTEELNMQQGFTRTETTAEMRDDPEHSGGFDVDLGNNQDGNKSGSKGKSPNAGDSGGGLFSGVDDTVDDIAGAIGW